MGRSSGGGGHSSGGFGGGRSSGGFHSSGRSSSSFSRSSSSHRSSSRSSYHSGPIFYGGPRVYGRPRPPRRPSHSSLAGVLASFIIILICIGIFISVFALTSSQSSITKNTTERTPLSGVVSKTDWYDDQIGWIRSSSKLISGLEDFYKETGVQPYVMLIPYSDEYWNGNTFNISAADDYLNKVYDSHFKDEGHFIFAYFACLNDVESEMDGEIRYLSGYAADTIMDNEALDILEGYYNKNYYNTDLSTEKLFGNTFSETAKSIMSRPTNGWDFMKIAVIVIGIVGVIGIIYSIIKIKAKREKEKEEYTKEILDKPLETFGEDTSDLEEKYK